MKVRTARSTCNRKMWQGQGGFLRAMITVEEEREAYSSKGAASTRASMKECGE